MKKSLLALIAVLAPLSANAAFAGIKGMLLDIKDMLNLLLILATAAALLFFFWGLAKFIRNADNSKSHEEGRGLMIWGTIALFVIATTGGLILFLQQELNLAGTANNPINIIQVPNTSGS